MSGEKGPVTYRAVVMAAGVFLILGLAISSSLNLVPFSKAASSLWTEGKGGWFSSSSVIPDTVKIWVKLAKELKPAVVNISTTQVVKGPRAPLPFPGPFGEEDPFSEFFRRFFGDQLRQFKSRSLGSGFILNPAGYIVTNNHVVENATEIVVKLSDGKEHKATLVGKDPKTDIALIKIEASNLPVIPFGDSDKLEVGEPVMAIGNPFGLEQTVTTGIVSAKGRVIGEGPYDDFIQTDASINPGNSGGPLISVQGEVVGINTAIFTRTGGSVGIGFAIPINMAKTILPQLRDKGQVVRGWLGVSIQPVTADLAKTFGLKEAQGALISDIIANSPADKAGFKRGDVITEFDGKLVHSSTELPRLVAGTRVGKDVVVKVVREGKELSLPVRIGELKEEKLARASSSESPAHLGIGAREITPELARQFDLPESSGVVVTRVEEGSPAEEAGIRPGDVLLEINKRKIRSLRDVRLALTGLKSGDPAVILVRREGSTFYVSIKGEG